MNLLGDRVTWRAVINNFQPIISQIFCRLLTFCAKFDDAKLFQFHKTYFLCQNPYHKTELIQIICIIEKRENFQYLTIQTMVVVLFLPLVDIVVSKSCYVNQ